MLCISDFSTQVKRLQKMYKTCSRMNWNKGRATTETINQYMGENYSVLREFILVDSVHKVALVSLPKTGSTTWRLTFLNSSGTYLLNPGQKVGFVHNHWLFQTVKGLYTKPATLMKKQEVIEALNKYMTILTVRHPFDRLESAYEDLVVSYNYVHIRERILRQRGLDEIEIQRLASNGSNIKFHEFLDYVLTHDDRHWTGMVKTSLPCNVNYR